MAIAEVIVHKTMGGHRWSNTHAIQVGPDGAAAPSNADLVAAGANNSFNAASTSGTGPTSILQAIVAAERALHFPDVTISDVLVTDGKRNTGPTPSTIYASISVGLAGTNGTAQTNAVDVGGVTILIHRNVVGFGHKPGRYFLRGAMISSWVTLGGPRMIQWVNNIVPTQVTSAISTAQGFLQSYMGVAPTGATQAAYVLPLYITPRMFALSPTGPKVGSLYGVIQLNGFSLVGPVLRQTQRGRKKKKV